MSLGPGEIFVVLVVALVVLGPEKLPGAAKQAGRWLGEFRRLTADLSRQINEAVDEADPTKPNRPKGPTGGVLDQEEANRAEHPGTEGFELIDKRPAPPAEPEPAPEPGPGARPSPNEPGFSHETPAAEPKPEIDGTDSTDKPRDDGA